MTRWVGINHYFKCRDCGKEVDNGYAKWYPDEIVTICVECYKKRKQKGGEDIGIKRDEGQDGSQTDKQGHNPA